MVIATAKINLRADWCHSLKEKRMVVNKIIDKVSGKFNVSISEVEDLDLHNSIVLGIANVSNSSAHGDSVIQKVINYIENITEAYITNIETEIL
ncbi:MAG: DUF503 domain-containing protein [Clostridiales bacterium]|uniref:DUF503 domain-containing protein n=1 Tax=Clostridium sp. N3C TaxID=1776758 RepID=UPI00092DF019|nr:DUF503 domain-containing protein [Clostridium sp. N3C]NLZ47828.1 DUF503 domain-containing protein [Clostridiales bacterium]SCN22355.1 hypothetical protein N3C_0720 [Clostridium sp. N3C]